jgi:hypothetical protein
MSRPRGWAAGRGRSRRPRRRGAARGGSTACPARGTWARRSRSPSCRASPSRSDGRRRGASPRRRWWRRSRGRGPPSAASRRAGGRGGTGCRREVRALPEPVDGALRSEVAERLPAPEVGRGVEADQLPVGERHHHHPPAPGRVPEDLGIAEVLGVDVQHGVPRVLAPGAAGVDADGQVLRLAVVAVAGVDGDEAGGHVGAAQPARVPPVVDGAAGEDHDAVLLPQREREVPPAEHVRADGVPPAHVSPRLALKVVLVEEVVLAAEVHEPVGVVHEVAGRGEVVEGPPRVARPRRRHEGRAHQ